MAATGIGASVRRVEDHRFITGKGQYVDDINRAGQSYAVFVRSVHAHATIKKIDTSAAINAPGVLGIFTGADLAADKIGNLICGWMIHSKDGSPMKAGRASGAWPRARCATSATTWRSLLPRRWRRRATQPSWCQWTTTSWPPASISPRRRRTGSRNCTRRRPTTRFSPGIWATRPRWMPHSRKAHHVTKIDLTNNRLIPNAMEPRAAIGEYDSGQDAFTLYTTSQNPHVARLVLSAFIGIAPEHKLRVIAPDVGGGFGSKIFIYAEETVCVWAAKKVGRPVKWTADRSEAFLSDAHGRDHVTTAEVAMDCDRQDPGAAR